MLDKSFHKEMANLVAYRWVRWERWLGSVDEGTFSFSDPSTFVDTFETQKDRVFPMRGDGTFVAQEGHGRMFVSSWTTLERSSAMWELYGKIRPGVRRVESGEWVVQVRAPVVPLLEALRPSSSVGDAKVYLGPVSYLGEQAYKQYLVNSAAEKVEKFSQHPDSLFRKRSDFSWEQEVRFLLRPVDSLHGVSYPTLGLGWQDVVSGVVLDPRLHLGELNEVRQQVESRGFECSIEQSSLLENVMLPVQLERPDQGEA